MTDGNNGDGSGFDAKVMFARAAVPGPFGKFDQEVKTHVDDDTFNKYLRECARLNKVPGVLTRDLIYVFVHGLTVAELVAKHDRQMLEGEGTNQGLLLKVREMSSDLGREA